jgi:glycosyltransferase involved in cell wall biosynthesis
MFNFIKASTKKLYQKFTSLFSKPKPAILFICNKFGGGVEKHLQDMQNKLLTEGVDVYSLTGDSKNIYIEKFGENKIASFCLAFDYQKIAAKLRNLQIWLIHLHHPLQFHDDFLEYVTSLATLLKIPYDFTVHDYFSICPRIHLLDIDGKYCGEPEPAQCNTCLSHGVHYHNHHVKGISEWRDKHQKFFEQARYLYVPNEDVANRMRKYYPQITFTIKPHLDYALLLHSITPPFLPKKEILTVAVIGVLGDHKGANVIYQCALDAKSRNLPIKYVIIGPTHHQGLHELNDVVKITGKYSETNVIEIIAEQKCNCAFFASIWPETYCYTLSIALMCKLYPIAFDIGAIATRIKSLEWGTVLPITLISQAAEINDRLLALEIEAPHFDLDKLVEASNYWLINDYYGYPDSDK